MTQAVLLIHGGAVGDLVLALRLLRGISAGPRTALCRNRLACFFAKFDYLAGWKSLEHPQYAPLFTPDADSGSRFTLDFSAFDVVVSLMGVPGSPFSRNVTRWCHRAYCIHPVLQEATARRGGHILEQWTLDLNDQGLAVDGRAVLSPVALLSCPAPRTPPEVWIHPGSGGTDKCWSLDNFEQLARRLQAGGLTVRFMIGPVEQERYGPALIPRLERIAPVGVEPDVCDAAACLQGAAAFIGNDAGMTHVAAALGVPTWVLFQVTDPAVWRPIGPRVTVLDGRRPTKIVLDEAARAVSTLCH